MTRKKKLTRDEHISLGERFVQTENRLLGLAREIGAAYPLSSRQIKKVWRTIGLLTETRMALDFAAGNEFPDLLNAYCNNSEHRKTDAPKRVVTDAAVERVQDLDDQIWAGYLIDGEMRWVEGYDPDATPYPGQKPLIVCHSSEFDESDDDTP